MLVLNQDVIKVSFTYLVYIIITVYSMETQREVKIMLNNNSATMSTGNIDIWRAFSQLRIAKNEVPGSKHGLASCLFEGK